MRKKSSRDPGQVPYGLLTGIAAGLIAGAAAGQSDRLFGRFVSSAQKRRERQVREGSAHEMAGPYFAGKISGKKLTREEMKRATRIFGLAYGVVWGLIYGGLRKKYPTVSRWAGLPFAIPFFFACDGTLAPILKISPNLRRIPWQLNVKEMGNHIAWTMAAEMVHRGLSRKLR